MDITNLVTVLKLTAVQSEYITNYFDLYIKLCQWNIWAVGGLCPGGELSYVKSGGGVYVRGGGVCPGGSGPGGGELSGGWNVRDSF